MEDQGQIPVETPVETTDTVEQPVSNDWGTTQWNEGFLQNLPDELGNHSIFKKYQDPTSFIQGAINAQSHIGQKAEEFWRSEDPNDVAVKNEIMGVPQSADQYQYNIPDDIDIENKPVLPITSLDLLTHYQRVIMYHFVTNPRDTQFDPYSINKNTGSNTWAIGPSKSASGNSMLIINPHLSWGDMFTWFEVQLNCYPLDIYGATLVGSPFIGIGFNEYIGWAHTNNVHDGQDLYKLTLTDGGYKWGDDVKSFDERIIQLNIKQNNDDINTEKYLIKESVHGPIIREDEDHAYALRVVGQDQPFVFEQYFDMALSKNFQDFEKAISRLQNPFFTTMYADRDGRILHLFGGRTPVRPEGDWDWLGIVPGDTPATLWHKTHSYDELPKVIDAKSGKVVINLGDKINYLNAKKLSNDGLKDILVF